MKRITMFLLLFVVFYSCGEKKTDDKYEISEEPVVVEFFDILSQYCGQAYYGEVLFPEVPEEPFDANKIIMNINDCSDVQIKIPFIVGEDKSRTWVISKLEEGLQLKHIHWDEDGSPHELTNYGGMASKDGDQYSQYFFADEETAEMLPEAAGNIWTLQFNETLTEFYYILHRDGKLRFKVRFDLLRSVKDEDDDFLPEVIQFG